MYFQRYCSTR